MVAREVAPGPEDLARGGVQASRAAAAEVDIDAPLFDGRRRRGVAVVRNAVGRLGIVKDLDIANDFAGAAIDANSEPLFAVRRRRRQPHLIAPDHGGGPALAVD